MTSLTALYRTAAIVVFQYIVATLVAICLLHIPFGYAVVSLDGSWQAAYNYFAIHHFLSGVQYVFSYGPLAFLVVGAYEPELMTYRLVWEMFTKFLFVLSICWLGQALNVPRIRVIAALMVTPLLLGLFGKAATPFSDLFYYAFFFVTGSVLFFARRVSVWYIAAVIVAVSVLPLIKLTYIPFSLLLVVLTIYALRETTNPRLALFPLAEAIICLAVLWFLSGQRLANIGSFLFGSQAIIHGYALNMKEDYAKATHVIAGFVALTAVIAFVPALLIRTSHLGSKPTRCVYWLLVIFGLLIIWKHSFVRADAHHSCIIMLETALLATTALLFFPNGNGSGPGKGAKLSRALLTYSLVVMLLMACALRMKQITDAFSQQRISVEANVTPVPSKPLAFEFLSSVAACYSNLSPSGNIEQVVFHPDRMRQLQEQYRQQNALPRIESIVEHASIDVWSSEQGIALIHRMNYQPRPVFQGYSAYTPYLQRRNADAYRGADAPEYVLFKMQTIDQRFPTLDDALALEILWSDYVPLTEENQYLLLKHQPGAANRNDIRSQWRLLDQRHIDFNEEIAVPSCRENEVIYLSLLFQPSSFQKLAELAWRPREVRMKVTMEEGSLTDYRLMPNLTEQGFLFSPVLDSVHDMQELQKGILHKRVRSFSIYCRRELPIPQHDRIWMKVYSAPAPRLLRQLGTL